MFVQLQFDPRKFRATFRKVWNLRLNMLRSGLSPRPLRLLNDLYTVIHPSLWLPAAARSRRPLARCSPAASGETSGRLRKPPS